MPIILNPNAYGPLFPSRLSAFEGLIGTRLPEDYREFLLENNGGQPHPDFFWISKPSDGSSVTCFYGLHEGPRWESLTFYIGQGEDPPYGIPDTLLAIGDDGCSDFICLGVKGVERGKVYFFDHEINGFRLPPSFEGITRISESFSVFYNSLTQAPDY